MSLYYEAAAVIANTESKGGSLKNRIFGKKDLKSNPGAVFALCAEATKWSAVLKEVIEKSNVLKLEKKVNCCQRMQSRTFTRLAKLLLVICSDTT